MVAVGLRSAVHGEVLGGGVQLAIFGVIALQAGDEGHAHALGEVRVLAVGFLAAAPAWVAEDVDVGRPVGEALVAAVAVLALELVVLGARLVADGGGHFMHQRHVEGGRQADRLREHGGLAGAGHTVQALVPPVVRSHAQARDGRRGVLHLRGLFLQRHVRDEVGGTIVEAAAEVAIDRLGRRRRRRIGPLGMRGEDGQDQGHAQSHRHCRAEHAAPRLSLRHSHRSLLRCIHWLSSRRAYGPTVAPMNPPATSVLSSVPSAWRSSHFQPDPSS